MKKQIILKSTDELAAGLYLSTLSSTETYFKATKKSSLDKSYWAWLHIGFVSALIQFGYSQKECDEIVNKVQELIKKNND